MAYRPSHRQLQYFLAVIDRGHFADAARACNVSQPTLSTQLKLLEDQLGAPLVERGMPSARPTPLGQRLAPLARGVLDALDEIVETARTGGDNLGGLIRLGVASTFGPYFMPRVLPRLHARYPALEIYIREDRPAVLEAGLADGAIDCIITPMPVSGSRFEEVPLCDEEIYLGVPSDHRLAGQAVLTVPMLAGEKLLTLGRGNRLYEQVRELCLEAGAVMREDYEGTSLDALRQMVSIGMGLSLFPAAYVASEFGSETAVRLHRIEGWSPSRTVCLAWRSESVRRVQFQALAEHAAAAAAELKITGVTPAAGLPVGSG